VSSDYESRGIENPSIIDLVSTDGDVVVLVMLEERPWNQGRDQLEELDAKLNSYFSYVIDGHLSEQYPEYAGQPVRVQLDTLHQPSDAAMEMVAVASRIANDHGFSLAVRLVEASEIARPPWEAETPG